MFQPWLEHDAVAVSCRDRTWNVNGWNRYYWKRWKQSRYEGWEDSQTSHPFRGAWITWRDQNLPGGWRVWRANDWYLPPGWSCWRRCITEVPELMQWMEKVWRRRGPCPAPCSTGRSSCPYTPSHHHSAQSQTALREAPVLAHQTSGPSLQNLEKFDWFCEFYKTLLKTYLIITVIWRLSSWCLV